MHPIWYPEDVLEFFNDGQCCGYAPSKRRKCQMPIKYANRLRCDSILDELSAQLPDSNTLKPMLLRLAYLGICRSFHQHQAEEMVEKWSCRISEAFPPRPEPPAPRALNHSTSGLSHDSVRPAPRETLDPSREETARPALISAMITESSEIEPLQDAVVEVQSLRSSSQPPLASTENLISREDDTMPNSLQSSSVDNTSRSSSNSPIVTQVVSPSDDTMPVPAETTSDAPGATSHALPIRQVEAASLETGTTTETESPVSSVDHPTAPCCTVDHVHRRSLREECSICYDTVLMSSCDTAELVWCRSSCGRSVHKSCFDTWGDQCDTDEREVTCPMCRSEWTADCECVGCTSVHAQRRPETGDCPICQEGIQSSEDEESPDADVLPLTWCDSGCGTNVHAGCFASWEAQCVENGDDATCVVCRVVWRDGSLSPCVLRRH